MQSLTPNHPIWGWLTQGVQASAKHTPHCSNLENLTQQSPSLMTCTIKRVKFFTKPPGAEQPARQPINGPTQKKATIYKADTARANQKVGKDNMG
jgi:hypothetical protein